MTVTTAQVLPPTGVQDTQLWRDASALAARHQPDPVDPTRCANQVCEPRAYPCFARRVADRADAASRGPWHASWTGRVDLLSAIRGQVGP